MSISENKQRGEADWDFIAMVAAGCVFFVVLLVGMMIQNRYEFELKMEALKRGCPTPVAEEKP